MPQITRFAKVSLQNNEPLQMESFPPSVQIESIPLPLPLPPVYLENKAIANFIQLVAKDYQQVVNPPESAVEGAGGGRKTSSSILEDLIFRFRCGDVFL